MKIETRLLAVRHGESDWNIQKIIMGHADRPLTNNGRSQANVISETLRNVKIDAIYSSDLQRALDTAKSIQMLHKSIEIMVTSKLRGRGHGHLEGIPYDSYERLFPKYKNLDIFSGYNICPENGETGKFFEDRVKKFLKNLLEENKGRSILIVTHSGVIKFIEKEFRQGYAQINSDGNVEKCKLYEYFITEEDYSKMLYSMT